MKTLAGIILKTLAVMLALGLLLLAQALSKSRAKPLIDPADMEGRTTEVNGKQYHAERRGNTWIAVPGPAPEKSKSP